MNTTQNRLSSLAGFFAVLTVFALPISITALSILYPLTLILSLLNYRNWHLEKKWWRHPIIVITALYFFLYVIGLTYSDGTGFERLKDFTKHLWILGSILIMPIFIEKKWRAYATHAFLCSMIFTMVLSYGKFFGLFVWRPELGTSALFNNYIVQNTLMAFACVLILDRALESPRKFWYLLLIAFFMVINIFFMSEGRSGYITFALLFCYLLFQRYRLKGLFPALLLLIILGGLAYTFSSTLRQRVNLVFSETENQHYLDYNSSLGQRYAELSNAWYLVKKSPWIGYGTGGARAAYATLPPSRLEKMFVKSQLDLDYFNILMKFGFIGLAVVLSFFALLWYYGKELEGHDRYMARALVLFFLLGCIGNDVMNTIVPSHFLSLFIAISFAPLIADQKSSSV